MTLPFPRSSRAAVVVLAALAVPACTSSVLAPGGGGGAGGTTGTGETTGTGKPGCGAACNLPETPWSKHFESTSAVNAFALAADATGNVVVAGTIGGAVDFGHGPVDWGNASSTYLLSVGPTGAYRYAVRVGDEPGAPFFVSDVAFGSQGDVYVTGSATGGTFLQNGPPLSVKGQSDAFLARFDAAGHPLWAVPWGDQGTENAMHLAVTPSGAIVIAGTFTGPESDPWQAKDVGVFVAMFNPNGDLLWDKKIFGFVLNTTVGVAADGAGNVVLAGGVSGSIDFGGGPLPDDTSAYLVKLDGNGKHVWSRAVEGNDLAGLGALAGDAAGNVVLSATRKLPTDGGVYPVPTQPYVERYDASGTLVWRRDVNVNGLLGGPAVALRTDGTVMAAGQRPSPDGYDEVVAVDRIDAAGNLLGEKIYGGHAVVDDMAVAVDPAGGVWVCGDYVGSVDFGQGEMKAMPYMQDVFVAKLGKL